MTSVAMQPEMCIVQATDLMTSAAMQPENTLYAIIAESENILD